MKLRTLVSLVAMMTMLVAGCADDSASIGGTDAGGTTDTGAPADTASPADTVGTVDAGPTGDGNVAGNEWEDTILPMLQGYCAPCHNNGTNFLVDASVLDNDAPGAMDPNCKGQTVAECIHTAMAGGTMPMGKTCPGDDGCPTQEDIDAVKAWVDAGAVH